MTIGTYELKSIMLLPQYFNVLVLSLSYTYTYRTIQKGILWKGCIYADKEGKIQYARLLHIIRIL